MELHVQLDLTASRILFIFHFTSGEVLYPGNGNDTFHSQHFPDLKDYRKNCKRRVHWHSTGYHLPYCSNQYSDSCYIPRSSNTYHQNWSFELCPSNWHRSETTTFANLVSYLKAFSDQKDPLETWIPWSINSCTSNPWQKTAANASALKQSRSPHRAAKATTKLILKFFGLNISNAEAAAAMKAGLLSHFLWAGHGPNSFSWTTQQDRCLPLPKSSL